MSARTGPEEGWFQRNWWVVLSLGAIVSLAIYLRTAFNVPIFIESGGQFAGNDPYFHFRAIRNIIETGHHFFEDPLLNYPGTFHNPNPPTFQWTVAILATIFSPLGADTVQVARWIQSLSPVIFGTLTVVAVYFVTAEVFDKKAGVVAAFLMAVMASHIERSMFGFADHDSYALFFIVAGMFFYMKALGAVRRRNWIDSWSDTDAIVDGLRDFADDGRLALVYAGLAGVTIANVALAWKGFHYAMAIIFGYAVFQLVLDQFRRETSLDILAITVVTMGIVVAMAWPWYSWAGMFRWFEPSLYIFTGFLVVGAWLVPTRDLPALLVLPLFVGFILGSLAIVNFAFPELAKLVFGGFGYFQQSAVYETIAEAHPADFSTLVFNFGVATFYMALAGLVLLALRLRKDLTKSRLFMLAWGVIGIYMGVAAMRFLFNASPVFAVMSGWITWFIVDRLDYQSMLRTIRGHGQELGRGLKRAVGISHVVGILFLAFAIVVPNTYFAIDAGMPSEYESDLAQDNPDMREFVQANLGSFGQAYVPPYWDGGLDWLAEQDTDRPAADRPAVISWWDYGHWISGPGDHPAVADNFQNNFFFAGRFLASQNESHAMQIFVAGYLDNNAIDRDQLRGYLADVGVDQANRTEAIEAIAAYEYTPHLSEDQAVEVYEHAVDDSGKIIRYAAIDRRLYPFDNPQTPRIDFNSIFFAPMTLAEVDQDSFVEVKLTAQVQQQGGQSRQLQLTQEQVQRLRQRPDVQVQVQGRGYEYKQKFFNSMVHKIYVGTQPPRQQVPGDGRLIIRGYQRPQPCFNMDHFRVVYQNSGLRVCKFYFGAKLNGTVRMTNGEPLDRVRVSALDPSRIPHGSVVTGPNGSFEMGVPFGNISVVAFTGRRGSQVTLGNVSGIDVTDEQAMTRAQLDPVEIVVEPGGLNGTVFWDRDGDGTYNPANDTALDDATVIAGQRIATTGDDGRYAFEDVRPGPTRVQARKEGYQAQPGRATIPSGDNATHNVSMTLRPVPVNGTTFVDDDGDGAPSPGEAEGGVTVSFEPTDPDGTAEAASARSDINGTYSTRLKPGNYTFTANATIDGQRYTASGTIDVPFAGEPMVRDVELERSV